MSEGSLNRAYLALGSNIDPERNLPAAVGELARYGTIAAVSRVWETAPLGYAEQANFLNGAVLLVTDLSANELRNNAIAAIEERLRRVRDPRNKNAPRTIDIDIALFNQEVLQVGSRPVPDPDLLIRPFVALAVAELEPGYIHPQSGRTLAELAHDFQEQAMEMIPRPDVRLPLARKEEPASLCRDAEGSVRRPT